MTATAKSCSVEGCERPLWRRSMCSYHYHRLRTYGTTDPPPPRTVKPIATSSGYRRVWAPDHPLAFKQGYVFEHRKVAWDTFGPFDPSMQVHHKNGDKTDNRPENLEVLSPSAHGQEHAAERRKAEPEEMARLYLTGLSTTEVGRLLGVHGSVVSRALARIGVSARPFVSRLRQDVDRAQIRRRLLAGEPARRIAQDLGYSDTLVRSERDRLGVPPRRPGRPGRYE